MLAMEVELRVLLLLNNLSDGDLLVKEVVLGFSLVAVLLLDALGSLERNSEAEVLIDTLTEVFVVQWVQDSLLIFIKDLNSDFITHVTGNLTACVDDGSLVLMGVDHLIGGHEEVVHVTNMMPSLSQGPSEHFTISRFVNGILIDVEVLFVILFVQLLDLEVDFIEENIPVNDLTLILVVAVREDLNLHFRDLATVGLDLSSNLGLVENVLTEDFTADGVHLSNLGYDFLKAGVDLFELLHALLLIHLLLDHHVVLFLLASLLIS